MIKSFNDELGAIGSALEVGPEVAKQKTSTRFEGWLNRLGDFSAAESQLRDLMKETEIMNILGAEYGELQALNQEISEMAGKIRALLAETAKDAAKAAVYLSDFSKKVKNYTHNLEALLAKAKALKDSGSPEGKALREAMARAEQKERLRLPEAEKFAINQLLNKGKILLAQAQSLPQTMYDSLCKRRYFDLNQWEETEKLARALETMLTNGQQHRDLPSLVEEYTTFLDLFEADLRAAQAGNERIDRYKTLSARLSGLGLDEEQFKSLNFDKKVIPFLDDLKTWAEQAGLTPTNFLDNFDRGLDYLESFISQQEEDRKRLAAEEAQTVTLAAKYDALQQKAIQLGARYDKVVQTAVRNEFKKHLGKIVDETSYLREQVSGTGELARMQRNYQQALLGRLEKVLDRTEVWLSKNYKMLKLSPFEKIRELIKSAVDDKSQLWALPREQEKAAQEILQQVTGKYCVDLYARIAAFGGERVDPGSADGLNGEEIFIPANREQEAMALLEEMKRVLQNNPKITSILFQGKTIPVQRAVQNIERALEEVLRPEAA